MKILLSLNYKLFRLSPTDFIKLLKALDKDSVVKGFEVCISSEEDKVYLKKLANICNEEKYALRLHAKTFENFNDCIEYLDFVNELTNIYKSSINIVIHPLDGYKIIENIRNTKEYISKIFEYIDLNNYKNIEISVENLNDLEALRRIKKENLEDILKHNKNLHFTYDIGHELIDGNLNSNLSNILSKRLNNVHVHSYVGREDHHPIKVLDDKTKLLKISIDNLKEIKFNGYVVAEYAIDYIEGSSFEEKLYKYVQYIYDLKNIFEI